LVSAKVSDFLLFEKCYNLIKQKQHLTLAGFEEILSLKYNINKGLPNELKEAFPNIVSVNRPEYKFKGILNPFWISGFVSGDSTFSVSIEKSNNKLGKRVRLIFGTCLKIRDKELLIGMANYFNNLFESTNPSLIAHLEGTQKGREGVSIQQKYIYNTETTSLFQIKNYSDIQNKIIPFFNKYPILGVKNLDFADFKIIANLLKNKEHLTGEGLSKIIEIVNGMNLDRNINSYIENKT